MSRDKCLECLPSPFAYTLIKLFVKLWTALLFRPAESLIFSSATWASNEGFKIVHASLARHDVYSIQVWRVIR